jgi:hypothetical protein
MGYITVLLKLLRRFRQISIGEVIKALQPRRFDVYLYEITSEMLRETPPVECDVPNVKIEKYTAGHLSGDPYIDSRVKGTNACYAAHVDGVIVHRSFLSWDIGHPAQFGFDPTAPLIIDAWTAPAFRGKRLHPMVRRLAIEDALRHGGARRVYSEIVASNTASRRGNERSGARSIARLRGIKFAGIIFRRMVLPVSAAELTPYPFDNSNVGRTRTGA